MNRLLIYILILFIHQGLFSQTTPRYLSIKSQPIADIWIHSKKVEKYASAAPRGFQLEWSRFNISEKSWRQCNCYARSGIAAVIYDYGNPDELGQSYNLFYFVEPYFSVEKKITFSYRAGIGLTYLNRVYHPLENPDNQFFSSPLSGILFLGLNVNYQLSKQWFLNTGLLYNHISNGGLKQPNVGMNFPTWSVGIDHVLMPNAGPLPTYEKAVPDMSGIWFAHVLWTVKTVQMTDEWPEVQPSVLGAELGYLKPISNTNGLSLGMEVIHDGAWKEEIRRNQNRQSPHSLSLLLGHHFLIGQFSFSQQFGLYTLKNFNDMPSLVYQRYGIYYTTANGIRMGFTMKAHLETAEIMDIRVGKTF